MVNEQKQHKKHEKVENGSYGLEFLLYGLEFLTLGIYTDMPSKPRRAAASILFFFSKFSLPVAHLARASASQRPEYVIIPRWFTVHHMRGGTLSEAGGVGPMNAVRRSTAARPLERARVPSLSTISAPLLSTG